MDLSKLSDEQLKIALKVADEAERQGLNPDFVLPMVMAESGFKQDVKSKTGAKGVMQLMPDTAKSLKVDPDDIEDNIRGGIKLLKELVSDKAIGSDPYKVLAAYNASTDARKKFLETGDLATLPDETVSHMLKVTENYGGKDLPPVTGAPAKAEEAPAEPAATTPTPEEVQEIVGSEEQPNTRVPRALTGLATGAAGAAGAATAATTLAKGRLAFDAVEQLAKNYPSVMADLKSGKSPTEVMADFMKAKQSAASDLPPAQGPLTGEPAGGRMTQNWVASQDAEGRYTDVGLKARDQAEAHQMKRAAMAAEDKIRQIAPEMRADPTRANLLIPQSAGRGPSPRFGGTPNVPVAPVAPPAPPTRMQGALSMLGHYGNLVKWPVMGGWTGFNLGQGAADVYNRLKEDKPVQAGVSALGTAAGAAAPFVGTAASIPLGGLGALIPAALYMQDNPEARQKFLESMKPKGAWSQRMEGRFGLD